MRLSENNDAARLAQNQPVTHRDGFGHMPSVTPNSDPCLKVEVLPIEALKPYDRNARTHSKKQIRQIAKSVGCRGQAQSSWAWSIRFVQRWLRLHGAGR
jgi:hypothetical protein